MDKTGAAFKTVLLLCCVIHCQARSSNGTRKLYILTLLPYPNPSPLFSPSWDDGPNIIPALDLAAQHVNQRAGLLDGYELELVHRDGGCDILSTTLTSLVTGLFEANNSVLGLIGPGCSASTLALLSTINQNRTSLIAVHGASSPAINRDTFPNSFGTLGSARGYVDAILALLNVSGWRNIATIADASDGPLLHEALKQKLHSGFPDATFLFSVVAYEFYIPLADLRESRARVVFVFASVDLARRITCLALRAGMLFPDYQWVFTGHALEDFTAGGAISFSYDGETYNCSTEEMATQALHGSVLLNYKLIPFQTDEPTFSGLSYREYLEEYNNSVSEHNNTNSNTDSIAVSTRAAYFYDAVWTWAIALDNATKSTNFSAEDYQLDQPNDPLIDLFQQIDFQGVSGHIKFDKVTGSVDRLIDVVQVKQGAAEYVALYNSSGVVIATDKVEFIEDSFPVEARTVHPALAAAVMLLLLTQVSITIAMQIAVIVHRDTKHMKASSPNISHLTYAGIYLLVIGFSLQTLTYSFYLEGREGALCQAYWAFFYPYGFTLAFGSLIIKTWRLYRIFVHIFHPGKFISEPALISLVCIMLAVDVVISIVWTTVDRFALVTTLDTSDQVSPVLHQDCSSQYYFAWITVVWGYRFLQLAALLALVCLTRKIKRETFQTVTLQVLVYGIIGAIGIGGTLYYFTVLQRLNTNITYAILGVVINTVLGLYVSCVFLPSVVPLMRTKWKERNQATLYSKFYSTLSN